MDWKSFLHKYAKKITFTSLLGLSVFSGATYVAEKVSEDTKAKTVQTVKPAVKKVKRPVYDISYRNDTLERATSILLYYSNNGITRNFVRNNNSYRMQMPYFAHEEWHHHNDSIHFRSRYPLKPLEYYRLCMHDEISANMVAILTARYEYLAAENKRDVINRYKNTYMKFYFEAVEQGKIKPESKDSLDIEKERAFLADGTLDMWVRRYKRSYAPRTYGSLRRFINRMGFPDKDNRNYNYIRNYMYTIGGVNFAKYLTKDIEIQEPHVLLTDGISKVQSLKSGKKEITDMIIGDCSYLKEVSNDKQSEVFQHILIAAKIKYMLRNKSENEILINPKLVDMCYRQTMSQMYKDAEFNQLVYDVGSLHLLCSVKVKDDNIKETMDKIYTYKGINLSDYIDNFDIRNVPLQSYNNLYFNFKEYNFYINPLLDQELDKKSPDVKVVKSPAGVAVKESHKSEVYHLKIPNFREPILTSATDEDMQKIFSAIREFEAIPKELKECNMEAQRKYWAKQNSLQNMTGLQQIKDKKSKSR